MERVLIVPLVLMCSVPPSSDVLADMRVNISEEGSDRVIWYKASICIIGYQADINLAGCVKERFLADDEIIEHFVVCSHHPTFATVLV